MKEAPVILWLASWYPTRLDPFPGDFIQRHAKALACYHKVHVLHIAKDVEGKVTKDILVEENVAGNLRETIVYYHPKSTGINALDRFLSMRKFLNTGKQILRKQVQTSKLDFIHLHVAMRHGLLARWAKKTFGVPYVITEHWTGYDTSNYPQHLIPGKWFWVATKSIFKEAVYFYPEVKTVGELINKTIAGIPYKPVSNTVDTSLFYYNYNKPNPSQCFEFIHVSTLSYQKNIDGILHVIERFATQQYPIRFTLVGPASDAIIQRVSTSPTLAKLVHLTGSLSYNEVAEKMRTAHAMVMFSRYENQPCVILEALCCGLPVVSTNVGGIAEVLDDSNGVLINNEDEDALFNALQTMVDQYNKYNREAIAQQAQQNYSYEKIGKQMLDYYRQDLPKFFR